MTALLRRMAKHPGSSKSRLILCIVVFCSVFGSTHQQDDSRTWDNSPRLIPSNAIHEQLSTRNGSADASLQLDENNIMSLKNSRIANDHEDIYSDEYEVQPEPKSQDIRTESIPEYTEEENRSMSKPYKPSLNTSGEIQFENSKMADDHEDIYSDEYEEQLESKSQDFRTKPVSQYDEESTDPISKPYKSSFNSTMERESENSKIADIHDPIYSDDYEVQTQPTFQDIKTELTPQYDEASTNPILTSYKPSLNNSNEGQFNNSKMTDSHQYIYTDDYEGQTQVSVQGILTEPISQHTAEKNHHTSKSFIPSLNASKQGHVGDYAMDQYDTYYYYDEDYDNSTDVQHPETLGKSPASRVVETNDTLERQNDLKPNKFINATITTISSKNFPSMEGSDKHFSFSAPPPRHPIDKTILIGEAVVSVVTTKSVVNGTISVPVTPLPMTTEQLSAPPSLHADRNEKEPTVDTTENSRILASVQTSRSISGARFLPFPVVEQVEQVTQKADILPSSSESTESINDKLDRVQSELSSGFLTGEFRNTGNTLQLDVLPNSDQTRKSKTTTARTPVINKIVPHRFTGIRKTTPLPSKNRVSTTTVKNVVLRKNDSKTDAPSKVGSIVVQDVSAFLPPGFKLDKRQMESTEKSIIQDIFAKAKVDISALLPPGYNKTQVTGTEGNKSTEKSTLDDIFEKSKVDISSLLPPNFNQRNANSPKAKTTSTKEDSVTQATTATTTKASGFKLVFPSRPGGRKPIHKITTPQTQHADAPGSFKPRIQKGWPVRATTEFTGWPTPSTTPISIEKLLEAARTATAATMNSSIITTSSTPPSTSTTTTTTTTPRPTTPGLCERECELAGTIRLVGNKAWVPELLDRNTYEWQQLANEVETEINSAFSKSALLRKWYKKIRIDSFSQGSILVDYFVELNDLDETVNTQELKTLFHDSLGVYGNDGKNESILALGNFAIDPIFTDFVVLPKVSTPPVIDVSNTLMPQWAIAVIVIGVGGLLFITVFGVSVLINRQNVAKMKPTMSTAFEEEVERNMMHRNHAPPIQRPNEYPKDDFYNMDAVWNEKSYESTSNKILMDGPMEDTMKYNLHDSWKSEWNGYYNNPSYTSSRSQGYDSGTTISRHHPDYDTNF